MAFDSASFSGSWNYPTAIRFGCGKIAELPNACAELGITKPMLVTDPGLAKLDITARAVAINTAAGLETPVFSDIKPNPVGANVTDGVAAFKAAGCDGVIAFGGGSALDAAKAIALMVGQTRPLWDYEDVGDWWTRIDPAGMVPCVAVPTTSGTGSEVGRASVIIDEAARKKKIIFHPKMLPAKVICDPELTVGLPAHITAAVGMDALSHNLEALCAPTFHPMAEGIAVEGIRLVREALITAVADGTNLEARSKMMIASTMGATAFQKGLGAMHALAHPIGAWLDVHHGLTNAVVMPYVLAFNKDEIADKLARAAAYIGLENASYEGFLAWILALRSELNIPHTADSLGLTDELCATLAPHAAVDPTAGTNPVALTPENCHALLLDCLHGRL
ncbi:MAG: iron-containing alcohol dehydrogenase [Myxococcales bacterium]|nr:iron-containing alcohol dehydrogenase [Myxococcales bacterium]